MMVATMLAPAMAHAVLIGELEQLAPVSTVYTFEQQPLGAPTTGDFTTMLGSGRGTVVESDGRGPCARRHGGVFDQRL